MPKNKKVSSVDDLSIKEMLHTNRFLNSKEDGEGNILTDYPIFAKPHRRMHTKTEEFFSAEEFCAWAKKLGCKIRNCGPTVIWEEVSHNSYLRLAQYSYDFEDASSGSVQFQQSA